MRVIILISILLSTFAQSKAQANVESKKAEREMVGNSRSRHGGSEGTGGGDKCEQRIQEIRDDILNWIQKDGPRRFKNLPVTIEEYSGRMLEYLGTTKESNGAIKPVTEIECVNHTIQVQGVEKTCRFDRFMSSAKITCNADVFMNNKLMSVDSQYQLIHHEYAGIADLETPSESQSQYMYSNQISAFLENQVIKKLAVRPTQSWQATQDGALMFHNYSKEQDGLSTNGWDIYSISIPIVLGNNEQYYPIAVEEGKSPQSAANEICSLFGSGMSAGGPAETVEVGPQEYFVLGLAGQPTFADSSFRGRKKRYFKITQAKCDILVRNTRVVIPPIVTVQ